MQILNKFFFFFFAVVLCIALWEIYDVTMATHSIHGIPLQDKMTLRETLRS